MVQAAGVRSPPAVAHLPFPPKADDSDDAQCLWRKHAGLRRLLRRLRLTRTAGYVTLADIGVPDLGCARPPSTVQLVQTRKKKDICGIAKPVSELSLSSNESTDKNIEYAKSISNRLQSPIESHFAVTPTVDSKTSSPANGFTSVEGGKLLCEELDNLEDKEPCVNLDSKHSVSNSKESIAELVKIHSMTSIDSMKFEDDKLVDQFGDLLSPAEETVSMFTQLSNRLTKISNDGDSGVDTAHNNSDDETCKPEKWTILGLHFGIPLFDEGICEKVCQSIVDRIAKPELLEKIKEDNEFIRSDLLKFVSQCQYNPGEDMGIVKRGTLVPLPRKNLVFENGRISEWSGK
ncbi:uncharacterized protein LOC126972152 isoform X2 [Leptidea sinapis]|nr:uncharacterized protein LOC126972152 isoform X2 [Leptidea sinapis]